MIEVLKQALTDAKRNEGHNNVAETRYWLNQYKLIAEQAIAELESQEPVAWLLTEKNINSLQVDSIELLINRLKHAHHTDLCVRINGQDEWFQADWLKHMVRVTPPQRTEPVGVMVSMDVSKGDEPEYRIFGRIYEVMKDGEGKDEVTYLAIEDSRNFDTPSQRTWQGLTDADFREIYETYPIVDEDPWDYERAIELKLKGLNE
jgi:hypothetical protein